jgi:protein involved in temperature-dependent protein secretion
MARLKPYWELNDAIKAARKTIKADPLPKTGRQTRRI